MQKFHKTRFFLLYIGSLLTIILSSIISVAIADRGQIIETKCRLITAVTNTPYERSVKRDEALIYVFHIERKYFLDPHNTNLRIEVEVNRQAILQDPVLFSVAQRKSSNAFELPYTFDATRDDDERTNASIYYTAGRNLCIRRREDPMGQNITVRVSTSSSKYVDFKLKLLLTRDFIIPIEKEILLDVSPTNPRYLGFQFSRPDISSIKIRASSDNSNCLTLSVQTLACPIFDRENNVRYQGLWQTMTTQAAMTLERRNLFVNGFVIVLVAHDTDEKCSKSSSTYLNPYPEKPAQSPGNHLSFGRPAAYQSPRSKQVKLIISNESKVSGWFIFLCLSIPVIATFLLLIFVTLLFRNRHTWMRIEGEHKISSMNSGLLTSLRKDPRGFPLPEGDTNDDLILSDLGIVTSEDEEQNGYEIDRYENRPPVEIHDRRPSNGKFNEKRIPDRKESLGSNSKWNWKADLCISDFSQKDQFLAEKSAKRFYWTLIIVAIFYSIPVYQLIFHYLRVLYRTGEYDICYYNYLCAHRLGVLVDFNHFWSNVSYVIFGFAFVYFVSRRANSLRNTESDIETNEEEGWFKRFFGYSKIPSRYDYGVPQNFGVFYALGIALAMEGVLSAAYHLCPNQSSFQFDTCFMYVISVLILLKIHQFRHPVHLGANHTYAILATFVLTSVIGLMFEFNGTKAKQVYRWGFITFQFLSMILLSIYFYSVGYVKGNDRQMITRWKIFCNLNQLKNRKISMDRLILPVISFLLGIAVLIYCELEDADFATYLLYVLVANVVGSTIYYVGIMKPLHGEFKNRTWVQPTVYFLGAGIIGGFAVRYFVMAPAEWDLSAAASREVNEECMKGWFPFHPYYDSHDVWHFLSAASLFLSFMALLIVDDDLITTSQSKIPVF